MFLKSLFSPIKETISGLFEFCFGLFLNVNIKNLFYCLFTVSKLLILQFTSSFFKSSIIYILLLPIELYYIIEFNNNLKLISKKYNKKSKNEFTDKIITYVILFFLQINFLLIIKIICLFETIMIDQIKFLIIFIKLPILSIYHIILITINFWNVIDLNFDMIIYNINKKFYYFFGLCFVPTFLFVFEYDFYGLFYRLSILYTMIIIYSSNNIMNKVLEFNVDQLDKTCKLDQIEFFESKFFTVFNIFTNSFLQLTSNIINFMILFFSNSPELLN